MKEVIYKEKYLVCDNGQIYDISKGKRLKKQAVDKDGYLTTSINGKKTRVHRIILSAFNGESKLSVDHLNMNKQDNRLINLEYVTTKENNQRMLKAYGNKGGIKTSKKVLCNNKTYSSARELSRKLGLSESACAMSINKKVKLKGHFAKYI